MSGSCYQSGSTGEITYEQCSLEAKQRKYSAGKKMPKIKVKGDKHKHTNNTVCPDAPAIVTSWS